MEGEQPAAAAPAAATASNGSGRLAGSSRRAAESARSRLHEWDSLAADSEAGPSRSNAGSGSVVLCRICERHILARQTAEHTRCCVLVAQCHQEVSTCDTRLVALSTKLGSKIDERRRLAEEEQQRPLTERISLVASFLAMISQLWTLATLWVVASLLSIWYRRRRPMLASWTSGAADAGEKHSPNAHPTKPAESPSRPSPGRLLPRALWASSHERLPSDGAHRLGRSSPPPPVQQQQQQQQPHPHPQRERSAAVAAQPDLQAEPPPAEAPPPCSIRSTTPRCLRRHGACSIASPPASPRHDAPEMCTEAAEALQGSTLSSRRATTLRAASSWAARPPSPWSARICYARSRARRPAQPPPSSTPATRMQGKAARRRPTRPPRPPSPTPPPSPLAKGIDAPSVSR